MTRNRPYLQSLIFTAALIAMLLVATRCGHPSSENETVTAATEKAEGLRSVKTQPIGTSTFRRTIDTTGTVAFNQNRSTQVLSPISGPVSRVLAEIGRHVSQGEALAAVSSPDFATDISALRKAESAARNSRRVADLDRQLFQNDAIARRDMEQAETDAVGAEADRDAALEQLKSLGVDAKTIAAIRENKPVENMGGIIKSPIEGTVVEKLISPGQLLQAGTTPCFTVADLSSVWVMANVFEGDLPFVAVGDQADVLTGSGLVLPAKVDYIAALVDPNTRAVSVRLDVQNPGGVLKRDLYVRVSIHSRHQVDGILVPVSAILRDDENLPFIFVAQPNGKFARRNVQTGSRIGDNQEVTSGLAAGETIVVEGGLFLDNMGRS